jgi:hypothetical protein
MLGSDASHVNEYAPGAGDLGMGPRIVLVGGVAQVAGERVERWVKAAILMTGESDGFAHPARARHVQE